jgi:hypothetical protein
MNRHFVLAVSFIAAACATPAQPVPDGAITPSVGVETGSQFELRRGQQANVNGTSLRIRFEAVTNDSRCPQGVQCVWAGNAAVNLTILPADTSVTLNTGIDPRGTSIDSYNLTLVDVKPGARQGGIAADDYRVVLEVMRR